TSLADEGPPETTAIRLAFNTAICFAPFDVAEKFLRAEGFTDVQYVSTPGGFSSPEMVARGEVDFGASFAGTVVYYLDAGLPLTAVSGLHAGCYELFAREPIQSVADLKGRRVGIQTLSSSGHLYVSIMARHVGLDPKQDIEWVVPSDGSAMELFATGQTDAFLGFPPEPQELRARKIGRVILSTTTDQPWSQYFCCIAFGNRDFVRASGRHQALLAGGPEGGRPLRRRPRARRATSGQCRIHRALRLRPADVDGSPLRPLARVRPGGRDALLRVAPARGRHDRLKPVCPARREHRLAFRQRAHARAEGASQPAPARIYHTEENGYDARITG